MATSAFLLLGFLGVYGKRSDTVHIPADLIFAMVYTFAIMLPLLFVGLILYSVIALIAFRKLPTGWQRMALVVTSPIIGVPLWLPLATYPYHGNEILWLSSAGTVILIGISTRLPRRTPVRHAQ